jgi:large repetitive protein
MLKKISVILSILALGAFSVNAGTVAGVADSAGANKVLAGVIVTVTPLAGGTSLSDTTNATGNYSIANASVGGAGGTWNITATLAGYRTYTGIIFIQGGNQTVTQDISLTKPAPGVTISGTVTDSAAGTPLAGALVRLLTIGGGVTTVDSVLSAANGTYSLTNVQAGTYNLVASITRYTAKTVRVTIAAANITQNFQLVGLPAGIVISGTVTDSISGTPLAGAIVQLRTTGGGGGSLLDSAKTAANGTYSIGSVQPGNYRLVASAAGHTSKTVAPVAVANANITQNFQLVGLPAGITISGTVTDSLRGTPLAGALIRLRRGGDAVTIDSVIAAANGSYSIDSVQAGTYTLVASAAGHVTKTLAGVTVAAANLTRNFQLVTLPGQDITGSVADFVTGMPLAGAIVKAMQGATVVDSVVAATNGTYTLIVPAGTYSVSALAAGHSPKTVTGVVVTNATVTLNFLLVIGTGTVSTAQNGVSARPEFSVNAAGILQLRNFSDRGVVSVFSLNGKLVCRTAITANETSVVLPKTIIGGSYLVSVTQKNAVYRKQVAMP